VVENVQPGEPFEIHETGWGEFEIAIKIYYIPESLEKPQTVYHHLRLHPYGNTDEEKENMEKEGEIRSWCYEEQIFNEPYEQLYDILTSPMDRSKGGKGGMAKGTRVLKGGMVGSVGERTATLPLTSRPDQPFSIETERNEQRRIQGALNFVNAENARLERENKEKQETLAKMKAERQNAA
jgi:YEATS domain-containing protein 4